VQGRRTPRHARRRPTRRRRSDRPRRRSCRRLRATAPRRTASSGAGAARRRAAASDGSRRARTRSAHAASHPVPRRAPGGSGHASRLSTPGEREHARAGASGDPAGRRSTAGSRRSTRRALHHTVLPFSASLIADEAMRRPSCSDLFAEGGPVAGPNVYGHARDVETRRTAPHPKCTSTVPPALTAFGEPRRTTSTRRS
jgi:hypothetical protein